jgi:outer membrane protein TolC
MGTSSSQIDSLQTIIPPIACKGLDESHAITEVRYRKGLVTYLDVLDAQRTVLAAETQLVFTERTRLTEMPSLFKALGGG